MKRTDTIIKNFNVGTTHKSTIGTTGMFLPPNLGLCYDTIDDTPTLIDREHYNAAYAVTENIYTICLGLDIGQDLMDEHTTIICSIPTLPNCEQQIDCMFYPPRANPVKFRDAIWLVSNRPFIIKFIVGSAILENNSNLDIPLRNITVSVKRNKVILSCDKMKESLPNHYKYWFHALRIDVTIEYIR